MSKPIRLTFLVSPPPYPQVRTKYMNSQNTLPFSGHSLMALIVSWTTLKAESLHEKLRGNGKVLLPKTQLWILHRDCGSNCKFKFERGLQFWKMSTSNRKNQCYATRPTAARRLANIIRYFWDYGQTLIWVLCRKQHRLKKKRNNDSKPHLSLKDRTMYCDSMKKENCLLLFQIVCTVK